MVNIDATVDSIKHAVEEAELMADCEITSVYAGIAGGHIERLQLPRHRRGEGPEVTRERRARA